MMKNIILVVFIIFTVSCKAQTVYPLGTSDIVESSFYVKDINNHHDDIIGVWRWENGNDSFEITLQEFEMYSDIITPNEYYDRIFGKYVYIENGETIAEVDTIQTFTNQKVSFIYKNPTEYIVFIRDIISDTYKSGEFILTSSTTATLTLRNSEGVKVNYGNGENFSLPTNITLIKQ